MKRHESHVGTGIRRRRAAVIIAAAVCVLLTTVLLASVLRTALMGREQVRREQRRVQAEWLAESGLQRAAARLALDVAYRGETWNIPAEELNGRNAGQVVIQVRASPDADNERMVTIEASYPSDGDPSAKRTRRARVQAAVQ